MSTIAESVSVVIPLYNHEKYIEEALESVLRQSIKPLEVIIVDDGSSDGSVAAARRVASRDPERVILWSQPNQGAHHAINGGIVRASGEYVAVLNSDDFWEPERLERCREACADADAVFSAIAFRNDKGQLQDSPWYNEARAFYDETDDLSLALINGNFLMTTSNLFVRRSVINQLCGFANLRYTHDLDLFLRLLVDEKRVRILDEKLLNYRYHSANTISEDNLRVKGEWALVTALYLWRRMARRGRDWEYYASLTDITDRHNLTRMIIQCFAFIAAQPPDHQDGNAWNNDEQFREFLREVAR